MTVKRYNLEDFTEKLFLKILTFNPFLQPEQNANWGTVPKIGLRLKQKFYSEFYSKITSSIRKKLFPSKLIFSDSDISCHSL